MEFAGSSGSTFNLVAGVKINTQQAKQRLDLQLAELSKKSVVETKIRIDGKDAIKQVTQYVDTTKGKLIELTKYYEKVQKRQNGKFTQGYDLKELNIDPVITKVKDLGTEMKVLSTKSEELITSEGHLRKEFTETTADLKTITTVTETYKNKIGELVTETTKLDSAGNPIGKTIVDTKKNMELSTVTIEEYSKKLNGVKFTFKDVINEYKDGTKVLERTQYSVDDLGRTQQQTNKYIMQSNGQWKLVEEGVREYNNTVKKANDTQKTFNSGINDFVSTMGKVLKFQIITKIITGFTNAVRGSIDIVKEYDKELTEFKKVSDLSGQSLETYTKQLGELGKAVARTRTEMVSATT